ncbi:hypothetical protein EJV47_04860 [Hymenobacter gummosus]|uniref:Lipocalin-like domain-containing protein n=1 Tax=Hymenobacter gummosus TaxID=1776032 RepID=A0A3S0HQL2_9BACT|nr:hypothetical protein [Hymenobacter gummosus]RTQ52350.1 hypothetical protein EJV47_04860 [Hymenobacter gummosus]
MPHTYWLRATMAAALLTVTLSCSRKEEISPVTLTGKWDLIRVGGGFTGAVNVIPPGTEVLTFSDDGTYTRTVKVGTSETNKFWYQPQP